MSGFVDLHIHGAFGVDITVAEPKELDALADQLKARGYASFLPTLVPLPESELLACLERLGGWMTTRDPARGATPLGVHLEGPFVSPDRAGALHPDCFLDGSDAPRVARLLAAIDELPGRHMVTLAPEIPGGMELVAEFHRRRFLVSVGHTSADTPTMERAVEHGARHLTHFCNAMRPLHHRDPGPIGFALTCDEVSLDLIADMHHLHPRTIAMALRCRGSDNVVLISDAMPAAGLADGDYSVWGETLTVKGGAARNAKGSLAGSVALLGECVDNVAAADLASRDAAHAMATSVPLRILERATRWT